MVAVLKHAGLALAVVALVGLSVALGVALRDEVVLAADAVAGAVASQPQAQGPADDLLGQARAARALDVWVKAAPGRECRVAYLWDAKGAACSVTLQGGPGDGRRQVTARAGDLATAAREALAEWAFGPGPERTEGAA